MIRRAVLSLLIGAVGGICYAAGAITATNHYAPHVTTTSTTVPPDHHQLPDQI